MPYRCAKCGQPWEDSRALDNELACTRRCGGQLALIPAVGSGDLAALDLARLPYPVALTARRLIDSLEHSSDVLRTLFLLKDCVEATLKYLVAILLVEYLRSPACSPERNEELLEKLLRPTLGTWVKYILRPLSQLLVTTDLEPGRQTAAPLASAPRKEGANPTDTELYKSLQKSVDYRNDTLGHGAQQRDESYQAELESRLRPLVIQLLGGVAAVSAWRLALVTHEDRCQIWMGPEPGTATEPGTFPRRQVGHFVIWGTGGATRDLFPFLCYLPDEHQYERLHFYDKMHRYRAKDKSAYVLEYDEGFRHVESTPVGGLEDAFTAELLAAVFRRSQGKMAEVEGRIASFTELIDEVADIVGRRFAIDRVADFLNSYDRGTLVIQAEPGKGKTALMAHLIERVYGHLEPEPVHFFYRRTAGITDPDVCLRSLYHELLKAQSHKLTESEASKQLDDGRSLVLKLNNLLKEEIAPKLMPDRPQLIFIDALDEAGPSRTTGQSAYQFLPGDLPAGVYVIASTRRVEAATELAPRKQLTWYDLDAPELLSKHIKDAQDYVAQELASADYPRTPRPRSPGCRVATSWCSSSFASTSRLRSCPGRWRTSSGDWPSTLARNRRAG